ncbi:MAG: dihydrolipoyl dehydrogenase, partial [Nitrospirae bacterium]
MRIGILGAGPGGYVAALKAAQLGAEVVVVEDTEVGGTCLNRGCIPTKAMLASSELYEKIKKADEFGISIDGTVTADLARIVSRKQKVIQTQIKGIKGLFRSWGVVLKQGRGRIVSERKIKIEADTEETIEVDRII